MLKKIASLLLCAVMLIPAVAYAAAPGVDSVIAPEIINPGDVTTLDVAPRLKSNVVAKVGERTVLYGLAHNSGGLYAFDITDNQTAVQLGSVIAVTTFDNKEAEMYVKEGHLIFANGNNVQINKLNNDGSIGAQSFSNATGGVVDNLKLIDDLLFACSENKNNGVTVYDISDPENARLLGSIAADNSVRSAAVEKTGDSSYRIYILTKARVDEVGTVKLSIEDAVYESGSFSAETVLEASLPAYDGFGWQGYGYTATDSVVAVLLKAGYIGVESNNSGRFVVDVTNPYAPAVIKAEAVTNAGFRYRKLPLDSTKVVEISKNSTGVYIMDYTDAENPEQLAAVTNMQGEGASILDNYLYTSVNGKLCRVKLYDGYTVHTPVVEKSDGCVTVSVNVDNHISQDKTMVLIAAIYRDDKMIDAEFISEIVPANEKAYDFSVDLDTSEETDYTFKAWMFDNFEDMTMLTDVAY